MSKVFYELDAENLTATLWVEGKEKEKQTIKGKWQTYSGDRASKNNTKIIFKNLPDFCEPQKTLTIDPKEPKSSFVPKLNTKTHTTSTATKIASIEFLQVSKFAEYLEEETDKKTFTDLLEKAKQVFAKKQAEQHKLSVNNHISGLEKLGLTKEALIELLQTQLKQAEKEKAEAEEKAEKEEENTGENSATAENATAEKGGENE